MFDKPKILSVDDSSIMRRMLRNTVEALNYKFLEAADGEEALQVLMREYDSVKLILLDWNMPGMNGIDFLKELRKNNHFKGIPVLMVTTQGEKNNIVRAIQTGATNYLLKPFTEEELEKKIRQTALKE